jgi:hypothetical protein
MSKLQNANWLNRSWSNSNFQTNNKLFLEVAPLEIIASEVESQINSLEYFKYAMLIKAA